MGFRFALFLIVLIIYLVNQAWNSDFVLGNKTIDIIVLGTIFGIFLIDVLSRFFPSRIESPGCNKQFAKYYKPATEKIPNKYNWRGAFFVFVSWVILNGIVGALYFTNIIDKGVLILISLTYSVCDMICILFFCPFQTWMMKNKCCTTCRIYNWDFIMMFTPLIFIMNPFAWILVGASLLLLVQWEITYIRHPERFTENTNASIKCENCSEKLCFHKKQLQSFKKKLQEKAKLKIKQ